MQARCRIRCGQPPQTVGLPIMGNLATRRYGCTVLAGSFCALAVLTGCASSHVSGNYSTRTTDAVTYAVRDGTAGHQHTIIKLPRIQAVSSEHTWRVDNVGELNSVGVAMQFFTEDGQLISPDVESAGVVLRGISIGVRVHDSATGQVIAAIPLQESRWLVKNVVYTDGRSGSRLMSSTETLTRVTNRWPSTKTTWSFTFSIDTNGSNMPAEVQLFILGNKANSRWSP